MRGGGQPEPGAVGSNGVPPEGWGMGLGGLATWWGDPREAWLEVRWRGYWSCVEEVGVRGPLRVWFGVGILRVAQTALGAGKKWEWPACLPGM